MDDGVWILGGYQSDFARNLSKENRDFADLTREVVDGTLTAAKVADAQATLAQLPPGILSDILSALAANADPLTSGLLGIASTLNPQVGSAQPIVIPTPIGELDVIALYIASIATGSIALAITNTARPWHIGLYGNAGGLGPTQGHPLSSPTNRSPTT